jgi:hypothetical protein
MQVNEFYFTGEHDPLRYLAAITPKRRQAIRNINYVPQQRWYKEPSLLHNIVLLTQCTALRKLKVQLPAWEPWDDHNIPRTLEAYLPLIPRDEMFVFDRTLWLLLMELRCPVGLEFSLSLAVVTSIPFNWAECVELSPALTSETDFAAALGPAARAPYNKLRKIGLQVQESCARGGIRKKDYSEPRLIQALLASRRHVFGEGRVSGDPRPGIVSGHTRAALRRAKLVSPEGVLPVQQIDMVNDYRDRIVAIRRNDELEVKIRIFSQYLGQPGEPLTEAEMETLPWINVNQYLSENPGTAPYIIQSACLFYQNNASFDIPGRYYIGQEDLTLAEWESFHEAIKNWTDPVLFIQEIKDMGISLQGGDLRPYVKTLRTFSKTRNKALLRYEEYLARQEAKAARKAQRERQMKSDRKAQKASKNKSTDKAKKASKHKSAQATITYRKTRTAKAAKK